MPTMASGKATTWSLWQMVLLLTLFFGMFLPGCLSLPTVEVTPIDLPDTNTSLVIGHHGSGQSASSQGTSFDKRMTGPQALPNQINRLCVESWKVNIYAMLLNVDGMDALLSAGKGHPDPSNAQWQRLGRRNAVTSEVNKAYERNAQAVCNIQPIAQALSTLVGVTGQPVSIHMGAQGQRGPNLCIELVQNKPYLRRSRKQVWIVPFVSTEDIFPYRLMGTR